MITKHVQRQHIHERQTTITQQGRVEKKKKLSVRSIKNSPFSSPFSFSFSFFVCCCRSTAKYARQLERGCARRAADASTHPSAAAPPLPRPVAETPPRAVSTVSRRQQRCWAQQPFSSLPLLPGHRRGQRLAAPPPRRPTPPCCSHSPPPPLSGENDADVKSWWTCCQVAAGAKHACVTAWRTTHCQQLQQTLPSPFQVYLSLTCLVHHRACRLTPSPLRRPLAGSAASTTRTPTAASATARRTSSSPPSLGCRRAQATATVPAQV